MPKLKRSRIWIMKDIKITDGKDMVKREREEKKRNNMRKD